MNLAKVEYLLVGRYAVGIRSAPRFTANMDIWVGGDSEDTVELGQALKKFGFKSPAFTQENSLKPGKIFRFGAPPLQIDILTDITGCRFADCYPRREVHRYSDIEISVLSIDDLRANKRAAGRAKDLADLEGLE